MKRIKAFTVIEVVIVMALTSILLSILFSVLQRFNTATANEVKIKSELNSFFQMRSTIWKDLDKMDSLKLNSKDKLTLFCGNEVLNYNSIENGLVRISKNGDFIFDISLLEMKLEEFRSVNKITFIFDWKDEEVTLSYPIQKSPEITINDFFIQQKWQKR